MNNIFEKFGLKVPEILLPENIDTSTWSVVACDQYTQDREYWAKVKETTEGKPSTLNIILPEVYLNDSDKPERILQIKKTMQEYIAGNVFAEPKKSFIYIERTTAFGRTRKGLMACLDLDSYEWKPFSQALVRATEATILERIPPRMEIRRGAPLESPHIMLLVNDSSRSLIEKTGEAVKKNQPVYSGSLMQEGGKISGWEVKTDEELTSIKNALEEIARTNTLKDGQGNVSTFLFAVGDGNHSLATAKSVWEEHKAQLAKSGASEEEISQSPVRYALVEIVNIYDEGLTFEPIHRVIFNAHMEDLISSIKSELSGTTEELNDGKALCRKVHDSKAGFGFAYLDNEGKQKFVFMNTQLQGLLVSFLQPALDQFLKTKACNAEIDYIHGDDEVLRLGTKPDTLGIILPPIAKDTFFATITQKGPLPRKSFSMGEAAEKRFYLECRKLFNS